MSGIGRYQEIFRLRAMLNEAGIKHTFTSRGEPTISWESYQIILEKPDGKRLVSVIEGDYTYGYEDDRLEIMGLLTEEEQKHDSVVGWLTAEEIFSRIQKALREEKRNGEK